MLRRLGCGQEHAGVKYSDEIGGRRGRQLELVVDAVFHGVSSHSLYVRVAAVPLFAELDQVLKVDAAVGTSSVGGNFAVVEWTHEKPAENTEEAGGLCVVISCAAAVVETALLSARPATMLHEQAALLFGEGDLGKRNQLQPL